MIRNPYPDLRLLGEKAETQPTHLWLESTSRCNTRCKTCPHFYATFGMDMSEEVFRKIQDGVLDGVRRVDLIGCGEPLIARYWQTLFDMCAQKRIKVDITTNGICLSDPALVRKLVANNVTLAFSCDGARKETYEFVRPFIRWEKTLEAFESIRRCAQEAGRGKHFTLRINFVAMKQNIADLPDLVRMAKRYGASSIYVMQLSYAEELPRLTGQSLHDAPELVVAPMLKALWLGFLYGIHVSVPHRFREHILQVPGHGNRLRARATRLARLAFLGLVALRTKGFKRMAEILFFGFGPKSKVSKTFCSAPWEDSFIAADGVVHPCCVDHPLGDLKTQKWRDIWEGEPYRNLRRTIHGWNPTRVCRFCELANGLNGGDRNQYARFFARFKREAIPLDSLRAEAGLHALETSPDGAFTYRWTERRCRFSIPLPRRASFLELKIFPLAPCQKLNSGRCTINNGPAEPFDTSCDVLHFPLTGVRADRLEVELELAEAFQVDGDPRELALGICGIELLSE